MQNIGILFVGILACSLIAGYLSGRKRRGAASSHEEFFLGGRSLSWPLLSMTFLGTQVGGGFILGTSDASYDAGLFGAFYSIGLSLGMLILGCGVASRLRMLEVNTISDVLEKRFQSTRLKEISGMLSVVSMGGILMVSAIGLRKFLFSLGVDGDGFFFLSWLAVILYTTQGGLLAVVWTDAVQAVGMVVTLLIAFCWIALPRAGEIITASSSPELFPTLPSFSALIVPMLFMLIEQDMAQRAFSAKSPQAATKACCVTACALLLLAFIPASFGVLAKLSGVVPEGASTFILVAQKLAPTPIFLAAASAVLLAILSTASSVLLAVSSSAVQDMRHVSSISPKVMTCAVGVLAGIFSYLGEDIIAWIVASYEVSVYTLFVPIMYGIFTKREKLAEQAALLAIFFGGTVFLTKPLWSFFVSSQYIATLLPLAASLLGYVIGARKAETTVVLSQEA